MICTSEQAGQRQRSSGIGRLWFAELGLGEQRVRKRRVCRARAPDEGWSRRTSGRRGVLMWLPAARCTTAMLRRRPSSRREQRAPNRGRRGLSRRSGTGARISCEASLRITGSRSLTMSPRIFCTSSTHGHLLLVREVEGLAAPLWVAGEPLRERHVRRGSVLDVEVIAHERAVRTDHRLVAAEHGADRPGHDPVPVQIAAAVEVPAACDRDRQVVRRRVRRRDEVGARLADVVRVPALQRRVLGVGQDS